MEPDGEGLESCESSEASDVGMEPQREVTSVGRGVEVSPQLQAEMLSQFLHVLSELDEVLDASLLEDVSEFDASTLPHPDEDHSVCPTAPLYEDLPLSLHRPHSTDPEYHLATDNWERVEPDHQRTQDLLYEHLQHTPPMECTPYECVQRNGSTLHPGGLAEVSGLGDEREELRGSMRRLEPLTLPVLLFLEHHVNMRPNSAPLQTQMPERGETEGRPTMVGRRSLLTGSPVRWPPPGVPPSTAAIPTGGSTPERSSSSASSSDSGDCLQIPVLARDAHTVGESREEFLDPSGGAQEEEEYEKEDTWPHALSPALACLSCTVGLFNISRFSVFSVHFGAAWVVQWALLSLCVGAPLLAVHASLGRVLRSGALDMWRVSPVLRGVGAALLAAQLLLGVYSVLGVSWLLVYFRDSFVTADDAYRWAMPRTEGGHNYSQLHETVPRYWNGEVLQRSSPPPPSLGAVKFQTAFNLSVVWLIVFVALSKGLRSYGKAVYVVVGVPACGVLVLATKLLTLAPADSRAQLFPQTQWQDFFVNTNSWAAAAQETFLTWGLLGGSVMQLSSHRRAGATSARALRRELACVTAATFGILLLAAFLANICVMVLRQRGYLFIPSSYETATSGQFLWPLSEPLPPAMASTPVWYMGQYASAVGVTVWRPATDASHSGWQPLQLATQLVPAALAAVTTRELSPVWAVLFYFILILLGVAQQLAIWHGVITGIIAINRKALRPWKTSITFFSCLIGLMFGLVLATDGGVHVVHWLDFVVTGGWLVCLLHALLLAGVFLLRGRPYSGDTVVTALYPADGGRCGAVLAALLSFMWTLVLPVLLVVICVVDFRAGHQRQLYSWRRATGTPAGYWAVWARRCGAALQLGAPLSVCAVAVVQTYRYMNKGPADVLERLQCLYRPRLDADGRPAAADDTTPLHRAAASPRAAAEAAAAHPPDPPPKYTPPPSYSTATGARLLATLRRSFRAVRRLTTTPGDGTDGLREEPPPLPATVSGGVEAGAGAAAARVARNSLSAGGAIGGARGRRTGGAARLRASLRRSFKFAARSGSREQLARGAEPTSSTVAMTPVVTRDTGTLT